MSTLSFGIFLAPYHCPAGDNPTAAYACDLDVLRLVDGLSSGAAAVRQVMGPSPGVGRRT